MAIHQRKQAKLLLTFKILHFVNQLRRRVKSRTLSGSVRLCQLGSDTLGLRAIKHISTGGRPHNRVRNTKSVQHGPRCACKRRRRNANLSVWSAKPQRPRCRVSAGSDASSEEVQHTGMLSVVDHLSPAPEHALSAVAGNNQLFLQHSNGPIFEGYSLKQTIQLLASVQEALGTFSACRSQYGDEWLAAQGLLCGLEIDALFIANYEHLLLRLQAELVQVLARKAFEELLRGGHDKKQRRLLAWFTEFADKPQPLSTSFPWTIKPSLAVLWGVCWMFYDRAASEPDVQADTRVRQERLLQHLEFPSVPWSAPASSDYVNFGLELIGAQPQHSAQQAAAAANGPAGLAQAYQARNAETWTADLSALPGFRLAGREDGDVGDMGELRYGHAPPQLPGPSTYYHGHLDRFPADSLDSYLPHSPGSPLVVFPQLGADDSLDPSWQLPYTSLPHQSRRQLISLQTPTIRVTTPAGCDPAQPHSDFAAFAGVYQQPQAPPLPLNTTFPYPHLQYNMTSQMSPDTAAVQVPHIPVKHERTSSIASNSNIPTPVSMSGSRSPLPSPTSGKHVRADSAFRFGRQMSEDRSSQDGEDDGSLRKNYSYKRSEEPPRTHEGKMTCRHHECNGVLFDRKCEWSKHMDKHDRPYKCNVKGCEKLQGFTYSGGLLRHEREVHKMHGGTKKSLFCPFHDCKRSSGAGFTRKENLAEHIRRVHRRTSMSADMHGLIIRREANMDGSPIPESRHTSESPYARAIDFRDDDELASLKRKRGSDSGLSERDNEDLRAEIKRLRQENEEKDSRLRQLEQAVMALQHQTRR